MEITALSFLYSLHISLRHFKGIHKFYEVESTPRVSDKKFPIKLVNTVNGNT